MQIFTLKKNDSLLINGEIVVKLVAIHDDTARLACLVPPEVSVHRKEIFDAIARTASHERDHHFG
ncbi:MAG TPA: carbon storage regulator [Pirellulales bacterium]|nr:carbon storage regulator [Pirellulales bacterium]